MNFQLMSLMYRARVAIALSLELQKKVLKVGQRISKYFPSTPKSPIAMKTKGCLRTRAAGTEIKADLLGTRGDIFSLFNGAADQGFEALDDALGFHRPAVQWVA
jgi:hypothetical protein